MCRLHIDKQGVCRLHVDKQGVCRLLCEVHEEFSTNVMHWLDFTPK